MVSYATYLQRLCRGCRYKEPGKSEQDGQGRNPEKALQLLSETAYLSEFSRLLSTNFEFYEII